MEEKGPDFYRVERVNIYLCDHKRQEIYQIVEGGADEDNLVFHSSQSGIAGKVSNEGKSFTANVAHTYVSFEQEIDDPKGEYSEDTGFPVSGQSGKVTKGFSV